MNASASMASGVKLLFFHHAASAAPTVKPVQIICSSWALSMGSKGLPAEQLICQGEAQRCGTGQSTGGDGTVGNDMCVHGSIPFSCMFVCF